MTTATKDNAPDMKLFYACFYFRSKGGYKAVLLGKAEEPESTPIK